LEPEVTGRYRAGDIRHCYADVTKTAKHGFEPSISIEEGMEELANWTKAQKARDDFEKASKELEVRGLLFDSDCN